MLTAIRAASGKAEEEPILDLYRRRIRGPRGNVERLGCCTPDADRRGRGAFSWGGGQRNRTSSGRRGRRRRSKRQVLGARRLVAGRRRLVAGRWGVRRARVR